MSNAARYTGTRYHVIATWQSQPISLGDWVKCGTQNEVTRVLRDAILDAQSYNDPVNVVGDIDTADVTVTVYQPRGKSTYHVTPCNCQRADRLF